VNRENLLTDLSPKQLKTNLILNCGHEFSWGFGIAFNTTYAIVPLFLKSLGAPDSIVISVAGLFSILIAIPQFLSALIGRNIRKHKKAIISSHILALPPIFIAGFVFAFLGPSGSNAWIFYYTCFILYGLALGFIIPIWTEFISYVNPRKTRGRFLGISFAFNSVGGFVGGIIVKILLNSSAPFPNNFGWGLLLMFLSLTGGTSLFLWYHLSETSTQRSHITIQEFWQQTQSILIHQKNFRRYLLSRIFITAHFPGMSMYAVHAQQKFGFNISEAGIFTILAVVTSGLASFLAGKVGDKFGHKISLAFSLISYMLAALTALFVESMFGVYAIFIFLGIGQGGFMPSAMNMVYEFAGNRDSKMYMAIIDTFLMPFTILAIVLAGYFIPIVGADVIFTSIVVFIGFGVCLLIFYVKEPLNTHPDAPISMIS
jgi:MFS family permease